MAGALMLVGVLGVGACSDDTGTPKGDVAVDLVYAGDQALAPDGLVDTSSPDAGAIDGEALDQAPIADGAKPDAPTAHDGTVPMDCPKSEPVSQASCMQDDKQCGYDTRPDCGNI